MIISDLDPDPTDPVITDLDPDPDRQKVSYPGGSGSATLFESENSYLLDLPNPQTFFLSFYFQCLFI